MKSLSVASNTAKVLNPSPGASLTFPAVRPRPSGSSGSSHLSARCCIQKVSHQKLCTRLLTTLLLVTFRGRSASCRSKGVLPLLACGGAATRLSRHRGRKQGKRGPRSLDIRSLANEGHCAVVFTHNALSSSPLPSTRMTCGNARPANKPDCSAV